MSGPVGLEDALRLWAEKGFGPDGGVADVWDALETIAGFNHTWPVAYFPEAPRRSA